MKGGERNTCAVYHPQAIRGGSFMRCYNSIITLILKVLLFSRVSVKGPLYLAEPKIAGYDDAGAGGRPRAEPRSRNISQLQRIPRFMGRYVSASDFYYLICANCEVDMIEADIVLGHLIGNDGPPIPIMAHPPATSSDLSLADFLYTIADHNAGADNPKGVKLDFKSIEAFEASQDQIAPFSKPEVNFQLWLNADILPGPVNSSTVPVDAFRFLKLSSGHPRAVLSIGWTTNYGGDVTSGRYEEGHAEEMLRVLKESLVSQTVTFPVRAGLAAHSQEVLIQLLEQTSELRSTLTVWSSEGDPVDVDELRKLMLTVGLDRTYLDVPQDLKSELHLPVDDDY
ncbi:Protein FAM151B [Eumeta japonica]|uniref:Protein FAM151B n=1 Tax=Eumeta variegata TaxID=151549 RepID=A0A4C1S941_EUMVA|nr:Protein FAM151B [Eumeta japonica]